jgi:protein gp37
VSDTSKIEWTDATWNPVRGCIKVSPGCANCYAETFAERFRGVSGHPYEQGFDLRLVPGKLTEPLSWKKPRRVFVNSMSDLFQDGVPDDYIAKVFAVMAETPRHTYQVLTKRPERMHAFMVGMSRALNGGVYDPFADKAFGRWPLPNVWLGVSVENQHFADERIPLLLQTPAAIRFISAEPLLGPLFGLDQWLTGGADNRPYWTAHCPVDERGFAQIPGLDWVIVGGESGPGARPFDVAWARSIVQQCKAAGVSCFVKQLGSHAVSTEVVPVNDAGVPLVDTPARRGQRLLLSKKGGLPKEWPADLRVREFPEARS